MATVTVRRKPTYTELEAKVKELQDALVIAERNKCLRDVGWDMLHNQIKDRDIQIRALQAQNQKADRLIEELNDEITAGEREIAALVEEKQVLREQVEDLSKRVTELKGNLTQKDKTNTTATNAAIEMAEMLIKANAERDEARSEAENLKLEIQERDFRIDELEKQTEWLRDKNDEWAKVAADQKDSIANLDFEVADLRKDVKFWKKAADENAEGWRHAEIDLKAAQDKCETLKKAVDEISEQSADFCAKAQCEEERAEALDAANQKLYAQLLGQRDSMDYLQRQLKANEESYDVLKEAYDELQDAARDIVKVIHANTFAN